MGYKQISKNEICKTSRSDDVIENRVKWGDFHMDQYFVDACFSENINFEVGAIYLTGKEYRLKLEFPFSHCYRMMDRKLAPLFYQVPDYPQSNTEYPVYIIENSMFIKDTVANSGGVLGLDELEHFQILSFNAVIDVLVYREEKNRVRIEGEIG